MDPKRLFFTLVFGVVGGYWTWHGGRTLRGQRGADGAEPRGGATSAVRRRAVIQLAVGLLVLLAIGVLHLPVRTAP